MINNSLIGTMSNRKSIRKYRVESPSDEVLETVVRAGQQAPFAYQLCSLLLSRDTGKNPLAHRGCSPSASIPIAWNSSWPAGTGS